MCDAEKGVVCFGVNAGIKILIADSEIMEANDFYPAWNVVIDWEGKL